jgi:thiol:disulfide interchange protein DsbC
MSCTKGFTALLLVAIASGLKANAQPRPGEAPSTAAATLTKEEFAARHAGLDASDIHDGPIAGVWEIVVGTGVSYVTQDGRFLIQGEITDLDSQRNLTEARRAESRAALLAALDPETAIVFAPENGPTTHRIYVFTDVDCGYCRQFHRDIAAVTALGIEVRYVAYPRTGPNSESWTKAENVWCASDRQMALTQAKLGADVAAVPGCSGTPVAAHYDLGRRVGVTGTPAIYSESGVELGGYIPPDALLVELDRRVAESAGSTEANSAE